MALRFLAVYFVFLSPNLFSQESPNLDVRLFRTINDAQTVASGAVECIDQTSVPLFVSLPAGLLLWGVLGDNHSALDTGFLTLSSQVLVLGVTSAVKAVVDRPRPFEVLRNVKVKRLSSVSGSSFPSGHAAQAFAIATILAYQAPWFVSIPAVVWAGYVGYARIYVGVHYPSDILAGIVTGIALSYAVYQYRELVLQARVKVFGGEPSSALRGSTPENFQLITLRVPLSLR
jgi:undecaprenyl-diphosphatase